MRFFYFLNYIILMLLIFRYKFLIQIILNHVLNRRQKNICIFYTTYAIRGGIFMRFMN